MITLEFVVGKQNLTRIDNEKVVANSTHVYKCHFAFSDEWIGKEKTATFTRDKITSTEILDASNSCYIPAKLLKASNGTKLQMGVFGVGNNEIITSTVLEIPVVAGSSTSSTLDELGFNVYEQIMQRISEVSNAQIRPEIIAQEVNNYLAEHPVGEINVAQAIEDYFTQHPIGGVDSADVEQAIEDYFVQHPIEGVDSADVAQAVADYFVQHPVQTLDENVVAQAVSDYLAENPIEGITENAANTLIANYFSAHRAELKGDKGDKGATGNDGKSAYQSAVDNGFNGTESEWLDSLVPEENVAQAVSAYLAEHPIDGMSEEEVAQAVNDYLVEHPIEAVGTEEIAQAVNNYLEEHPANVTENDIKNAISLIDGIEETDTWTPITLTNENSEEVKGYLDSNGGIASNSNKSIIVTLSVQEGEQYLISAYSAYASKIYVLLDANGNKISSFPSNTNGVEKKEVELTIPANVATMKVGTFKIQAGAQDPEPITISKHMESGFRVARETPEISDADVERAIKSVGFGDVLANKKWAACGDSYTIGYFEGYVDANGKTGTSSDAYDLESGHWKTYPWWIAKRNNMTIQWLAQAGNDFTNVEDAVRPFSAQGDWANYTQVDADCDYITLAFGLNEMHMEEAQIGAKTDSDNTTLWGAYNVVMEALIRANPFAKIGIIITDSWLPTWYRDVLIDIAKYWGVPYLDLKAGENIPAGIGGRNGNTVAQSIRDAVYTVSTNNSHPSLKAHEFRSTIIENFLRSL